jgi:hypothetical protein
MELSKFAQKPSLYEVIMDDADLIATYGEPITFYTWDVVSLKTYFEFYNSRSEQHYDMLAKIMRSLVLDKHGKPLLAEDDELPIDIAAAVIQRLGTMLGKSLSKPSIQTDGTQP